MTQLATHVLLVRHAQSNVNVERVIGGRRSDRGLTEHGREQAERLRVRLLATAELQPDVLVSSSLPRALATAEHIAPALGLRPLTDDGLCEMDPGEADGLSFEEYEVRYGPLTFDPTRPLSPGGETWGRFARRVSTTLGRLTAAHAGRRLLLVAHGWVIEASFLHFFGLPKSRTPRLEFQVTHTSLTHWYEHPRDATMRWFLGRYNDAAHLLPSVRWDR
jgi:probable phosphoglycerate mutase